MKRYIKSAVTKFEDELFASRLAILETTHSVNKMKLAIDYAYHHLTEFQWTQTLIALAKNPNVPEDLLVQMAKDSEGYYRVQYFLIKNPNLPESLREDILNSLQLSTRISLGYTGEFSDFIAGAAELIENIVRDACKKFNLDIKRVNVWGEKFVEGYGYMLFLQCPFVYPYHLISEVASCIDTMMHKQFDCKNVVASTCVDGKDFSGLNPISIDM